MALPPRLRAGLPALALVAATFAAYLPALTGGFVWDDDSNVSENPAMHGLAGLWRTWSELVTPQHVPYYPLTLTSFWLQVQTTGLATWPLHAVNVALHAATALLLAAVLQRLKIPGATLAAWLFALHPLNVESVAWITERKNVLSGALGLGAVLAYLDFDALRASGDPREQERSSRFFGLAFGLYALALLAKTTVSMLPPALAVVLFTMRGRRRVRALLPLLPFVAAGCAAGMFTALAERTQMGARGAEFAWSPAFRVVLAGRAFLFYLAKLVAPVGSMFFYPKWTLDPRDPVAWAAPLAVLAIGIAAVLHARARKDPRLLGALLAYAALAFPALGFFNVYFMLYAYVQNHFAYLAAMPVVAVMAVAVTRLTGRVPALGLATTAGLVAVFAGLSASESAMFRDYDTLFRVSLERNPAAWIASYNLGFRALQAGRATDAVPLLAQAAASHPGDPDTVENLGAALGQAGRVEEALPWLAEGVRLEPQSPDARQNHATALARLGRLPEAVREYGEAIRLRPDWPRAERELAWLLGTSDDPAVRDGRRAVDLATRACARTTKAVARCEDTLSAALAAAGDFDGALAHEQHAIELARGARELDVMGRYEARRALYANRLPFLVNRGTTAPSE